MKIIDSRGIKRDISSFFHSKSKELRFKKYHFVASFFTLVVFALVSVLFYIFIEELIISLLLITLLAALLFVCRERYLSRSIMKMMNFVDNSIFNRKNKKYKKYYTMNSAKKKDVFKKRKFSSSYQTIKNFLKDKLSGDRDDDSSYIEIK